jgi:hypothetical protein
VSSNYCPTRTASQYLIAGRRPEGTPGSRPKELVRSYLTITQVLRQVMTRVKAIYRSWAIPCSGKQV